VRVAHHRKAPAQGHEHVGLRTVRLGGEARRSAARRVLAAARAGAFAALLTTIPSFAGKIPAAPALLEARAALGMLECNALQVPYLLNHIHAMTRNATPA